MIKEYRKGKTGFFWLLLWLFSSAFPVTGQVNPKKLLAEEDYKLWGRLDIGKMNSAGSWISWRMRYDGGRDSLYVGRTSGGTSQIAFTDARKEDFVGSSKFAYLGQNQTLHVLDLASGTDWKKAPVQSYQPFDKYNLLLLQSPAAGGLLTIDIVDFNGRNKLRFKNVKSWVCSPNQTLIAIVVKETDSSHCTVLRLQDLRTEKVTRVSGEFEQPTWDRNGRFVAFAKSGKERGKNELFSYDTETGRLSSLDTENCDLFSNGRHINSGGVSGLSINEDGKAFFFYTVTAKRPEKEKNQLVEIWNSSDKIIYPAQRIADQYPEFLLAYWNVEKNVASLVADAHQSSTSLTGNKDYAIVFDRLAYEPQFDRDGPVDFYLVDIKRGQKKKWLSKRTLHSVYPLIASNKILYKEGNWKVLDPENGSVLDCDIPTDTINAERLAWNLMPASDAAGKFLIMNDGADLWKINMSTGEKIRLTYGREKGLAYRLPEKSAQETDTYSLSFRPSFDLSKPLVLRLKSRDGSATGYCLLLPDGTLKNIAFSKLGHSDVIANAGSTCFGYIAESFDSPRALKVFRKGKTTEVFSSNPHQKKYKWGKAELVKYMVSGQEMQGILYCPEGTDKHTKRPLITHIYEIQSDHLFKTMLPGTMNAAGFNVANLVGKGYFVLLPDIRHGLGNPGKDATASLNAALDMVIANYPIEPAKLGLIGHSFGGYETAAVVGYTDRFRAAVMGAGMSDAISNYLTANRNNSKVNYWRYEYGQSRIRKSLFEDKQAYIDNSPVLAADRIKTPLLIWTGANDTQVEPEQSYKMHLALRRLGKRSSFLVYPNEEHSLETSAARRDLTLRIQQWFDYYLKDEKPADWIASGVGDK